MILDRNLTLADSKDAAATTTRAIPLGQGDLSGNTQGLTAYKSLIVHVSALEAAASVTVTLETSDYEAGPYEVVHVWPAVANVKPGTLLVNDPMPWTARNWVRIKLSSAMKINAHLAEDTNKPFPVI